MKLENIPTTGIVIGAFLLVGAATWATKARGQAAPAKCGIYQEQETHLGDVRYTRIRDTCAHLVCMSTLTSRYTSSPAPAISCVKE